MNVIKRLMSRRSDIGMNFSGKEVTAVSSGRFSADGVNLLTLQPAGVEEHRLYDNLRYSHCGRGFAENNTSHRRLQGHMLRFAVAGGA